MTQLCIISTSLILKNIFSSEIRQDCINYVHNMSSYVLLEEGPSFSSLTECELY